MVDAWLVSQCATRTLLTLVFMTYAACLPALRIEWHMSGAAAGSVSTGFQLAYAVSLLGFSSLADRIGARRVFLASALLSAMAAVAFATLARSYASALILHSLLGASQGGTYTTAIMLMADRYPSERRGRAVGWLIASSSLGYALSLLLSGMALRHGGYRLAFVVTAAGPVLALPLAWLALRSTPTVVHARQREVRFGRDVLRNGNAMRLILGYTFHSWELLGMWTWIPAFLAASFVLSGSPAPQALEGSAYLSAAFHVMGLLASSTMGRLSDSLGRRPLLVALAAVSTVCSFTFGWLPALPALLIGLLGAVYAFAALGDSPVLSTALTEEVNPSYLGSALALRSLLGFSAGAVAPLAFGVVLDASNPPAAMPTVWGWGFVALGLGGLGATLCAYGLPRRETGTR
jgi:MFS family permease